MREKLDEIISEETGKGEMNNG